MYSETSAVKQEVLLILNFYVTQCTKSVIEGEEYLPSLNIGYTMNPRGLRDLDARGNKVQSFLISAPRRKGVEIHVHTRERICTCEK